MTQGNDNPYRRKPKAEPSSVSAGEPTESTEKLGDHASFTNEAGWDKRKGPRKTSTPRGPRKAAAPAPGERFGMRRREEGQARGLRKLPADLEELADGRADRVRRPRREPEMLEDERIGFIFQGVRNQEARDVFDARVKALRVAHKRGDDEAVGRGLCDVRRLTLWRARNVLDFAAFAENVVGLGSDDADALVRKQAEADGIVLGMLPAHVIALWLRTEAALIQTCPTGTVTARGVGEALHLVLHVPVSDPGRASLAFFDMGGAAHGLRRFIREEQSARSAGPRERGGDRERAPARGGDRERPRGPRKDRR